MFRYNYRPWRGWNPSYPRVYSGGNYPSGLRKLNARNAAREILNRALREVNAN